MTTNDKRFAVAGIFLAFTILMSAAQEDKQIHVLLLFIFVTLLGILLELIK